MIGDNNMKKKQERNDQAGKARIGAIGENLVVAKLMQQGWDAFNAYVGRNSVSCIGQNQSLTSSLT